MNTKSLSTLLCAAMCMLLPAGTANAAPAKSVGMQLAVAAKTVKTGSLTVAVQSTKGEAGSGLIVELLKNRGDLPPLHAKTNTLGVAQFSNLPADTYLVLIYSPRGELLAWQMATVTPNMNNSCVLTPALP